MSQGLFVPQSPAAGNVELDVDYEKEVKPFLGKCLVRNVHPR